MCRIIFWHVYNMQFRIRNILPWLDVVMDVEGLKDKELLVKNLVKCCCITLCSSIFPMAYFRYNISCIYRAILTMETNYLVIS